MPRGVKKQIDFDDEIAKAKAKLSSYQSKISNLTDEIKELETQKQNQEVSQLYQFLKDNDLSVEAAKSMIETNFPTDGAVE